LELLPRKIIKVTIPESKLAFAVQESSEGGYEARALGFPIFAQADSLDELKVMVRDAISCHFDDPVLSVVNYSLKLL